MRLKEDFPTLIENLQPETSKTTMRKNFIIPKLVAALDRCQLSMRDSVFILEATIETLEYNSDEFPISKSSIQRIRTEKRKERAEAIKANFQNDVPEVVTIHWDGKLLPALNAPKSKEERLPIVIVCVNQLIPRLESSSGIRQMQAVWNAIVDYNLEDKLQIHAIPMVPVCFLNRNLKEICLLLQQAKSFVYELVLKSVFEVKISHVTTDPDIPLFKKFQDTWKSVNPDKIQCCKENFVLHLTVSEIDNLLELYRAELTKEIARDDFRELIELSVIFLGGDTQRKFIFDLQLPCTKFHGSREQFIP
ncbi:hypothetical protein J437_LFUL003697 [Ladona fulva]|uniref:Uncharacterized protein n=1 Tax=Ladona fulva TaxID=123851 RepID=A0A8K0JWV8_LADFU|nr:hypothetical protein J437_LFUL003697 [Ladona fulva]